MALNAGNIARVELFQEIMKAIETAAKIGLPAATDADAEFRRWRAAQMVKIYCALEVKAKE